MNTEYLLAVVFAMSCFGAGFSVGRLGTEPPPVVKTTDQQCVAWLFEANMKDVKKKVCK